MIQSLEKIAYKGRLNKESLTEPKSTVFKGEHDSV